MMLMMMMRMMQQTTGAERVLVSLTTAARRPAVASTPLVLHSSWFLPLGPAPTLTLTLRFPTKRETTGHGRRPRRTQCELHPDTPTQNWDSQGTCKSNLLLSSTTSTGVSQIGSGLPNGQRRVSTPDGPGFALSVDEAPG